MENADFQHNTIKIVNIKKKFSGRLNRILNSKKTFFKEAMKINADVYHLHDPELLSLALKLKKQGKKVIFDSHEDTPKQIMGKHYIPLLIRKPLSMVFEKYETFVTAKLDAIVAATPTIKNKFLKINKNTIDVNNYPILEEFIDIPNDFTMKKNQIVYIGGLSKERGANEMALLSNEMPDTQFVFCGKFSALTEEEEAKKIIKHENVNFTGFVSRSEIQKVLEESKIGLVLLERNERYKDSLPIKLFEYMAAGIPVIASNFQLWETIIDESKSGFCVDPKDTAQQVELARKIINDNEYAKQLGDSGRKFVLEKYNWNNESQKLLELYKQLEES
ncbi:glycosyltransferase family 4 protein [Macrococcus animalis]|uniref:glycosyltransferase family 4 protein n=1 Tax=Macrococcus animalis TaxID=3395467 RepID=UPI0039BE6F10